MPQFSETLLRELLGRRLAQARLQAGLTQKEAGAAIQRSRTHIARIETGDPAVVFRDLELGAYLNTLRVDHAERRLLMGLAAETRPNGQSPWWHDYTQTALPSWFRLFVMLEDAALRIRQYEEAIIPGLLQTRGYAELILADAGDLDGQRKVSVRMERQSLLTRPNAPRFGVILGEEALRRQVGCPGLMARQLHSLLGAARRGVSVRVMPFTVGAHTALGTSFSLFDFPAFVGEPLRPPTAYVDTLTGAMYLTSPAEVAAYEAAWNDLDGQALDQSGSVELMETIRREHLAHVQSNSVAGGVAQVQPLR